MIALATAKSIAQTRATVADRVKSRQSACQLEVLPKRAQPATESATAASEGEYEDRFDDENDYVYEDHDFDDPRQLCISGDDNRDHHSRQGIFAQLLAEAKEEIDAKAVHSLEAKLAEANEDAPSTVSKINQVQELCACTEVMARHILESTGWNVEFAVETFFCDGEKSPAQSGGEESGYEKTSSPTQYKVNRLCVGERSRKGKRHELVLGAQQKQHPARTQVTTRLLRKPNAHQRITAAGAGVNAVRARSKAQGKSSRAGKK